MAYNLGKIFKDILKIGSLGVMASINSFSGDVFAFQGDGPFEDARGFRRSASDFQGDMSLDDAMAAAMAASMTDTHMHARDARRAPVADGRRCFGFRDQGAHGRGAAAAEDDGDYALALQVQEQLKVASREESRRRRAAAAAVARDDESLALAMQTEEELRVASREESRRQRAAAAAAAEADRDFALAVEFQEKLNAALLDQSEVDLPQGAAMGGNIEPEPSELLLRAWTPKDISGDGFDKYILEQAMAVHKELKKVHGPTYSILLALPEIGRRLKAINTGPGVSDKIDEILRDNI